MGPRWKTLAALTLARTTIGFQFSSIAAVAPFLTAALAVYRARLLRRAEG